MKSRSSKSSKTKPSIDDQLKKIGQKIKALRKEKGYSSYEIFAYENDFSRAQIGRYENGQDLRLSTLLRVLAALDVQPSEFFGEGID